MTTSKIERRFLSIDQAPIETRTIDGVDGPPTITGYGLVFFDPADADGTQYELQPGIFERFLPGCCDQTIREDDIACLFNHDPNLPIGRNTAGTLRLSIDARGCRYENELPNSPNGHNVGEAIRRRDVKGSSVGMEVLSRTIREDGELLIREIERIRLVDVSPTTFPAYLATSAELATRSIDEYRQQQQAALEAAQLRARRVHGNRVRDFNHRTAGH